MVPAWPSVATILPWRPRLSHSSGLVSNLPMSFRCDVLSQTGNSLTWILDLSFGGIFGGGHAHSLLDATPLRHFLSKHLDCDRIQDNIKRGHLFALAISATNYNSGKQLSLHSGQERPPHVEQKPAGDTGDQDYGRAHLRVGRHSIGLSARYRFKRRGERRSSGMVACVFNNLSARSYAWGQRDSWRSVFAAKISSIQKKLPIKEILRWRKFWAFFLM